MRWAQYWMDQPGYTQQEQMVCKHEQEITDFLLIDGSGPSSSPLYFICVDRIRIESELPKLIISTIMCFKI